jgi:hypothetical protein
MKVYMIQTLAAEPQNVAEVEVTFDNLDIVFPGEGVDNDPDEQPVRIAPAVKPQPKPDADMLDLSDEATLDRVTSGTFMRIKPEGSGVISVTLFPPAIQAKTHYHQGKNKALPCLQPISDFCCTALGEARDTVALLSVQYNGASSKDGSLKKGVDPDIKVGYINLSRSALRTMRQQLQEGETLYSTDWKIMKKTNGIGFEYFRQRTVPLYKVLGLEKQVDEVVSPYRNGVTLRKRIVKPMTLLEMKMLVNGVPESDAKLDDIETM